MVGKLPILNYHILCDKQSLSTIAKDESIYANEVWEFRQQMEHLRKNRYRGTLLDEFISCSMEGKDISENLVAITFDDGHISDYTYALPILQEYGFLATFFITVGRIGLPNYLSWQQIKEMASNGMSIESHTMTHPFLSALSLQEMRWELYESKSILEQQLGRPVTCLSLPGGRYNSFVKKIAIELGYKAVCTSIVGYNKTSSDLYSLKRWSIRRETDILTFGSIVRMRRLTVAHYKTRYFLLYALKKTLGDQCYIAIREKLL